MGVHFYSSGAGSDQREHGEAHRVVHGNQVSKLPDSYKRYMMNYYRRSLKVVGTPIQLRFQEGANPFEGKGEKLTLSQERRRKRMMAHIKNKKA